jgi:hypothetical protein
MLVRRGSAISFGSFGRKRQVMRPVTLKVGPGDLALPARHRLTAINRLAPTLNSAAPFSMAVASSGASTMPSHWPGGDFVDAPPDRLRRRFGLLSHARSIGRWLCRFKPAAKAPTLIVRGKKDRGRAGRDHRSTPRTNPTPAAAAASLHCE